MTPAASLGRHVAYRAAGSARHHDCAGGGGSQICSPDCLPCASTGRRGAHTHHGAGADAGAGVGAGVGGGHLAFPGHVDVLTCLQGQESDSLRPMVVFFPEIIVYYISSVLSNNAYTGLIGSF